MGYFSVFVCFTVIREPRIMCIDNILKNNQLTQIFLVFCCLNDDFERLNLYCWYRVVYGPILPVIKILYVDFFHFLVWSFPPKELWKLGTKITRFDFL